MNAIVMPTTPFGTLAMELRVIANREVLSTQAVEKDLAGTLRDLKPYAGRLLDELRLSAELVGQASMLLTLLAPHEAAVRALVEAAAPAPSEPMGERHACLAGR